MKLIFLALFLFEIALATLSVEYFGILDTFLIYFIPTFFGIPFFAFQNQLSWMQFQRQLALGRAPDAQMMNLVAKFIGTALILVPSMIARIFAILLLFPITRFFLVTVSKVWILQKLKEGSFRVFTGPRAGGAGFSQYGYNPDGERTERDARVVDIEALPIPPKDGRGN